MTKSLDASLGAVIKIGKLDVVKAEHIKLYAYKNYISDKKTFGFDDNGSRIGDTPNFIIDAGSEEIAAFIVRAVNAHDALVEALDEMLGNCTGQNFEDINPSHLPDGSTVHKAYMALKLARGEE